MYIQAINLSLYSENIMPFKCAQCDTIVQSMDNAECECANPFFVECVLIHYIHPEGPGEVFSKSYNHQGATIDDEGFSKQLTVRNLKQLKLGCLASKTNKKRELVSTSIMSSLVSCPDCLAFIDQLKSRRKQCQSSEEVTMGPTTGSTLVTPKSDSVSPTATMDEPLISMQSDKPQ